MMIRFSHDQRTFQNEGTSSHDSQEGGSGGKDTTRRFPDTPYPVAGQTKQSSSWALLSSSKEEAGTESSIAAKKRPLDPLEEYVSTVGSPAESPKIQIRHKQHIHDEEADEEGTETSETTEELQGDKEWESFVTAIKPSSRDDCPNLSDYLSAKSARETAKENFLRALDECSTGLRIAMVEEMLRDTVVAIYQEQGEHFEAHEANIIATMTMNHHRRKAMLKCMNDANTIWSKKYKMLRGIIELLETGIEQLENDEEGGKVGMESLLLLSEKRASEPSTEGPPFEKESGGGGATGGEPNWEELAEFEPTRDNIQSFLDARANFQNAEESLKQALDEIHAGLEEVVQAIVNFAVEIHDQHESSCMDLEQDIQFHLMENNRRRDILQQRLEESAKQAQGVFANLLSRLSMKL